MTLPSVTCPKRLVVVNTASGIKKVNDFFRLMEAVYYFITASSLRHDKFVDSQKKNKVYGDGDSKTQLTSRLRLVICVLESVCHALYMLSLIFVCLD